MPRHLYPGAGAVGNPAVYGNGVWNAYCYDANGTAFSTATYMGYYTEPLLSFNSANRWSTSASPSTASGYQGCQVDQINNWVSYRRTNIPAGTYQLNIPFHDDDVYVFINGVQVYTQGGCCVADTNVWTGTLSATDQIEFRWHQAYGASQECFPVRSGDACHDCCAGIHWQQSDDLRQYRSGCAYQCGGGIKQPVMSFINVAVTQVNCTGGWSPVYRALRVSRMRRVY